MSKASRNRLRKQFADRCAYCRSPLSLFVGSTEIDHIIPRSAGGTSTDDNLCLCCGWCNNRKSDRVTARDPVTARRVRLYHPQADRWHDHFVWDRTDLRLLGKTSRGRATIDALDLNNLEFIRCRRFWILAGWHPPEDKPVE